MGTTAWLDARHGSGHRESRAALLTASLPSLLAESVVTAPVLPRPSSSREYSRSAALTPPVPSSKKVSRRVAARAKLDQSGRGQLRRRRSRVDLLGVHSHWQCAACSCVRRLEIRREYRAARLDLPRLLSFLAWSIRGDRKGHAIARDAGYASHGFVVASGLAHRADDGESRHERHGRARRSARERLLAGASAASRREEDALCAIHDVAFEPMQPDG